MDATTWINFENFMLNERTQTQKATYLFDSISIKCPEQANQQRQKVDQQLPGIGERWNDC